VDNRLHGPSSCLSVISMRIPRSLVGCFSLFLFAGVSSAQHLVFEDGDPYPGNPGNSGELSFDPTALPVISGDRILFAVGEVDESGFGGPAAPVLYAYDGTTFSRFSVFSDQNLFNYQITSLGADSEGNVAAAISNSTLISKLEYWDGSTVTDIVADQTLFPGTNRVMNEMRIGSVRNGRVGFFAGADGLNNEQGLLVADGTSLTTVFVTGDQLPGMTAPLSSIRFQNFGISMSPDGSRIAFMAAFREEGVDRDSLYLWEDGSYTLLARRNEMKDGGTINQIHSGIEIVGDAVLYSYTLNGEVRIVKYEDGVETVLLKSGDTVEGFGELGAMAPNFQFDGGIAAWAADTGWASYALLSVDASGTVQVLATAAQSFSLSKHGGIANGKAVFQVNASERFLGTNAFPGAGGKAADLYPFSSGVDFGGGLRWSDWFGYLYDADFPFVYHFNFGWIYAPPGVNKGNFWFYDFGGLEWAWTNYLNWGEFYHAASGKSYQYVEGSANPREFIDLATQATVTTQEIINGSSGPLDVTSLEGKTIALVDGIGSHTATLSAWDGTLFTGGTVTFDYRGTELTLLISSGVYTEGTGVLWIQAANVDPFSAYAGSQANFFLDLQSLSSGDYTLTFSVLQGFTTVVEDGQDLPGTYTVQ
jgi:hypothetical protein